MNKALKSITAADFKAGMVLHFYGARFRLRDDVKRHERPGQLPVYTATGDWIDGNTVSGYFGPDKPWKFQGNKLAGWAAEA